MPIEPPSFFRPTGASGAGRRFGMGRRVRIREGAKTFAAGADGVIERALGTTKASDEGQRYRVRVALSDLDAASPQSEATLDLEIGEEDLAPFFDYSADPAAEAARIEQRQARTPLNVVQRAAPQATALAVPFGLARACVARAWSDPEFARRLVEAPEATLRAVDRNIDLDGLLGGAGLIVLADTELEVNRLVAVRSRDELGDDAGLDARALRLHLMTGARLAAFVLPCRPLDLTDSDPASCIARITPELLTGAAPPQR